MKKFLDMFLNLLENFIFSFKISFNASKKILISRILIEVYSAFHPLLVLYISKILLDLISNMTNKEQTLKHIIENLIILSAIEIVSIISMRVNEILTSIHSDKIANYINLDILNKTKSLDISFFDSPKFYNLLQLANRDSNSLQSFSWLSVSFIKNIIQIIAAFIIIFNLNYIFSILIIILSIPSVLLEKKFTSHLYSWGIKKIPEERKMDYIRKILSTREFAKEIRLFNTFDFFFNKYNTYWNRWFKDKLSISKKSGVFVTISTVLPQIGVILITIYVATNILNDQATIGDFTLYTGTSSQLVIGINSLILILANIYDNSLRINNYKEFKNIKHSIVKSGINQINDINTIEFKNVCFNYPENKKQILDNISFKINKNEKVALVGLNGEGKSTIIKLILRFYDVTKGEILINNYNIKEYNLTEYRKLFSVVFQDYSKYAFTFKDNIGLSNLKNINNKSDIINACKQVNLQPLIKKWPNGIDTYLTKQFEENGEELSGGQWQKIALARSLFSESKFIVFDEPTASLDPEAEDKLYSNIKNLCKKKGSIYISHRLSNIVNSDTILVLKNGKLEECGNHNILMQNKNYYYYLFNLQFEKYQK